MRSRNPQNISGVGVSYFRLGSYMRLLLLKKTFTNTKSKKILDIGCNYGEITRILTENNQVIGIDTDQKALKLAKKQNKQAKFIEANATRLPFKNKSFDIVNCLSVLEHIKKDQKVLLEISRVLKNKGKLFLTIPNQQARLVPPWLEPVIKQTNKLLKTDFPINDQEFLHYGEEGIGHVHIGYSRKKITRMLKKSKLKVTLFKTYWHRPTRLAYLLLMPLLRKKIIKPGLAKLIFLPFFYLDKIFKDNRGDILIIARKL